MSGGAELDDMSGAELSDWELRAWLRFEKEQRRMEKALGWGYTKFVIPTIGLTVAPLLAKQKTKRVRHSDPPPGPLSATGTRWFTAGNLKRLTDWPWGEQKTRRIFENTPGVFKEPDPETSDKEKHRRRLIPETLAYQYRHR
jgi:hypothetical protein